MGCSEDQLCLDRAGPKQVGEYGCASCDHWSVEQTQIKRHVPSPHNSKFIVYYITCTKYVCQI